MLELNKDGFTNFISTGTVLVDFYANWCGPCRKYGQILKEIEPEIAEYATIVKVNTDEQRELAAQYGISRLPTSFIFHNGEVVAQMIGIPPKKDLIENLKKISVGEFEGQA